MMEREAGAVPPELSRRVGVAAFADGRTVTLEVEADEAERAALARRFAIPGVESLTARLEARQLITGDILVEGTVSADVVQECVVTLEPVPAHLETTLSQRFTHRPVSEDEEDENEDPPEPVVDDAIEVGEIIVQNVSLALDPYPRAPGVAFEGMDDEAGQPTGPFAALARLRQAGKDET